MYQTLLKLLLKENLSLKRLMGFDIKKSKAKAILVGLAIIYSLVALIGAFGFMFFDLGKILDQMGQTEMLISFFSIYGIGLAIIITLFRASGTLFYYKDYEILSPLPIPSRTILLAKLSFLMIMLYLSSFVFTSPILFSYFYWNGFNFLSLIYLLIGFFFVPLIPVVVISLLSLGIAVLTAKMRHAKLMNTILMFVILIGTLMATFSLNEVEQNPLTGQIDLFKGIAKVYLPFEWYRTAIHEQSIIHLLYLVISNLLVLVLFIFGIEKLVHKTNQKGIRVTYKNNGKAVNYQQRSTLFALTQKEFKKYFSITLYAVNTGFGPIILMVAAVASLFFQNDLEKILAEAIGTGLSLEIMILLLIGFTLAMTYTPAISLSLEGKNFWIVKSLPIHPKTIMYSKVLFNILLCVPIGLLSVFLFGISLKIPFANQLAMVLLIITFATAISLLDGVINLYVPKMDYMNEVEVIKQSAGALLGIFVGFILMAINGYTAYLLLDSIDLVFILLMLSAINLIIILPLIWFYEKRSAILFRQIKA